EYVREMNDERFYELSIQALHRSGLDTNRYPAAYIRAALDTCKGKFKMFGELPAYAGFYFKDQISYDPEAVKKDFIPENKPRVERLRSALGSLEPFEPDPIGATFKTVAQELGVKTGILVHPARLACCGSTAGPSLYHLMAILGKDRVRQRLDYALSIM
ncbi:MAG TPA: glutamate--tRNA ligase, partial [Patescibacteria group bacterium]|nr:glutamate--tRNA ligase [Patescibacteria group bacterium]